jgi:Enoyl-CoA hydratase/isomerase
VCRCRTYLHFARRCRRLPELSSIARLWLFTCPSTMRDRERARGCPHAAQATTRMAGKHDFLEGVRAAVVDKDKQPAWRPASIAEVKAEEVLALLGSHPGGLELQVDS